MGNTNSSNDESKLLKVMKAITKLINNMSWKDMESLEDPEKCNKIIVLATDIFSKHLNDRQITYLTQRMHNNVVIDKKTSEKVSWLYKPGLTTLSPLKKKRMCQGIAKFYVKIAHVYAAIIKTLNPHYIYNDKKIPLSKYSKIPKNILFLRKKITSQN